MIQAAITLAFVGLLVGSAGVVGFSSPPPPSWGTIVGLQSVPLYSNLTYTVFGPPYGAFGIDVYVQPFNGSSPVETYAYTLPAAKNGTGYAFLNVSLSTEDLDLGAIQVSTWNASRGIFATSVYRLILPINNQTAAEKNEVTYVWGLLNATMLQNQALLAREYANNASTYQLYDDLFIIQCIFNGGTLFVVAGLTTRLGKTRLWYGLVKGWRSIWKGRGYVEPGGGMGNPLPKLPDKPIRARPENTYVAKPQFAKTRLALLPQSEPSIVQYLKDKGITEPRLGIHYVQAKSELKAQMRLLPKHGVDITSVRDALSATSTDPLSSFREA